MKSNTLQIIRSVWKREFISSAASPAPWIFLIIFLILISFLSFIVSGIFTYGQADLTPFFYWFPWLFLFFMPALGMPFWSEERRTGTFELSLSFPASLASMVWGKFLAGLTLLLIALILTAGIPLSALYLGKPDLGTIFCGYAGAFLFGAIFLAVSNFCSALTCSQTASFLLSLVICTLFMVIGAPTVLSWLEVYLPDSVMNLLASASFLPHYQAFQRGFIDTADLIYCLSMTGFFLYWAQLVLQFAASGTGNIFIPGAWQEKTVRHAVASLIFRTLAAFYVLLCINITASAFPWKVDLSQDGAFSLSPEAKQFAASLKRPAELRFYASSSSPQMPEVFKRYAERVEWLLRNLCDASGGKLKLCVLDPEPDSGDEQAAYLEGIKSVAINTGDRIYLGLSVSCADKCLSIPFLSLQQEKLLEYEIVRTIRNATMQTRPKIGVISAFKVTGDVMPTQLTQMDVNKPKVYDRAWYVISELATDYDMVPVPMDTAEISKDFAALLIIHPSGISQRTLFALDQYLLRGGKMAVFLDPRSLYATLKMKTDYSMADKLNSNLEPLLGTWGIVYNPDMIAADLIYAHRNILPERMVTNPSALELSGDAISRKIPLTAMLNSVSMWFAAPLDFVPQKNLKTEVLLMTSPNSQTVNVLASDRAELIIRNFRPGGKSMPLALRLTGKFPSAFPKGSPLVLDKKAKILKRAEKEGTVYLFGDTDMLFNDLCIRIQPDAYGQQTYVRQNDNVALLQNIMEQLVETDKTLSNIRSRNPMSRPLTRYNEMRANAEMKFKGRIVELERELKSAAGQAQRIRASLGASRGRIVLTPEQQQILRTYDMRVAHAKRELKEIRKQLRADLNRLDTRLRILNMALIPALVALAGLLWAVLRFSKWRKRS